MADHTQASAGGDLIVSLHGEEIGRAALPPEPRSGATVEIAGLGRHLQDAEGEVEVELTAKGSRHLSYSIELAYHAITPETDEACPVRLATELSGEFDGDGKAPAGEVFNVHTVLENITDQGQPMTVAVVGLPGGLEPRPKQLDELREAGAFDYYELRGRDVVFYWRTVEPRSVKEIDFDVTAAIPGKYTGPASRAYLYYTAEQKHWIEPLEIEIAP